VAVTSSRLGVRALGFALLCAAPLAAQSRAPADSVALVFARRPPPAPGAWRPLLGEYRADRVHAIVLERGGRLIARFDSLGEDTLTGRGRFVVSGGPDRGRRARFFPDSLRVGSVTYRRLPVGTPEGVTFRIHPRASEAALRRAALAARPPAEPGPHRTPDLVEVTRLDSTIHLDIRYATTNNFMGMRFYDTARAFLERPAAEALVRASARLRALGFGLLIHDAYRPWYVTKMFWDATPDSQRIFVADPSEGSRHNRGAAVDVTLYDRRTGREVRMTGGYDEFSDRSYADYPGGTSLERWRRDLLRVALEAQGFTVYGAEWWHFDYEGWRHYPILNVRFDEIGRQP
jgi:D-alanyl-D-alanine dipeptidase